MVNLVGKNRIVAFAHQYLRSLDYRSVDGTCRLCGQPKITERHNCYELRKIATDIAVQQESELAARQNACAHTGPLEWISHEEARCRKCGSILFILDD